MNSPVKSAVVSEGNLTGRSTKSNRMDKSQRKVNKVEKKLIWSVIEEMIDEMTTVQTYSTFVNCNLKKEIAQFNNKTIKTVVKQMTLEVAMQALAD